MTRLVVWILALVLLLLAAAALDARQGSVPLATEADQVLAQVAIARDGRVITIRGAAANDVRVCVQPASGQFGRTRCFVVGDIRAGRVQEVR